MLSTPRSETCENIVVLDFPQLQHLLLQLQAVQSRRSAETHDGGEKLECAMGSNGGLLSIAWPTVIPQCFGSITVAIMRRFIYDGTTGMNSPLLYSTGLRSSAEDYGSATAGHQLLTPTARHSYQVPSGTAI